MDLSQVIQSIRNNTLTMLDYIYDDAKQDWILLMEHSAVAKAIKEVKPQVAPREPNNTKGATDVDPEVEALAQRLSKAGDSGESLPEHLITEWYVLKGENKFGPFAFVDLVKMLQQKVIYEFDFIWHPGLASWKRIAEIESFKADKLRQLKDMNVSDIQEVFFRRRHRRMSYNGTILVHDNKTVWRGTGVEISAGGAGVVMENALITPGQTLYLHFKPCDGVPPFNAICEVVSKQYVDGVKDKEAPIRYGLRFTGIPSNTQQFLHELAGKQKAS